MNAELCGVDVDAYDYIRVLSGGFADERDVAVVECAHCWYKPDAAVVLELFAAPLT